MNKIFYLLFLCFFFLQTNAQTTAGARCSAYGKGQNLSNWLEAGWQVGWPTATGYTKQDLLNMKEAGIKSIRLPICFARVTDTLPPYAVDTAHALFSRVDTVIAWANELQMNLIIDNHHEWVLEKDNWRKNQFRFAHLWSVLAQRYAYLDPDRFTFELLNEPFFGFPNDSLTILFTGAIDSIRKYTTVHTLVISPNLGGEGLAYGTYRPLADTNLIYTWHCYDPIDFTHQGFSWNNPVYPTGTVFPLAVPSVYETFLYEGLKNVIQWKDSFEKPIMLGEFGVSQFADADSRCNWISLLGQTLDANKIPWFYWDWRWDFSMFRSHVVSRDSIIPCFAHALHLYGDTLNVGLTEAVDNLSGLNVYPNPVEGNGTLFITIKMNSPVACKITDNAGRLVQQSILSPSNNSLPLHLERGLYFIQLNSGNKTVIRKLVCE